jgi:hypothetical protein
MPASGPSPTWCDVRDFVAIKGKAEIASSNCINKAKVRSKDVSFSAAEHLDGI